MRFHHLLAASLLSASNWAAAVTLADGGPLPVTPIAINTQAGDQTDPHVDGDLVVYSSVRIDPLDGVNQEIRYYRFSTGTDSAIPNALPDGTLAADLLGTVNNGRIVFTRIFPNVRTAIMLFDTATGDLSELAFAPDSHYIGSAIGGQTVAFVDYGPADDSGGIMVLDLTTSALTRLTSGAEFDSHPAVSPGGDVVTWQRCTNSVNCDIYSATRSGGTWTIHPLSTGALNDMSPYTNGTQVVFERDNLGGPTGSDIVLVPVSGGAETVLEIPGEQFNPSIGGQVVAFESRGGNTGPATGNPDLYVADLANNRYFRITNTPSQAETLNSVTVLATGEIRLVWRATEPTYSLDGDIHAATFALPPVAVVDSTPPVLVVPASFAVDATSPSGAVVTYAATATDAVDPNPVVSCTPPSGSTFPAGTTAVTCTASDASGNTATASFSVTVFGAVEQIAGLVDLVESFNLRRGIEISLVAELRVALWAAGEGRDGLACLLLGAFINEVHALSGKAITAVQANQLIAAASRARAVLGCN